MIFYIGRSLSADYAEQLCAWEAGVAYRIFVSHVWRSHHEYYRGLVRLLDQAKHFKFVDLSVPKLRPFDAEARDDILRLLSGADVVVTINTPVIGKSPAVQDELTEAERLHIPIVAVRTPKRGGRRRTSSFPALKRAYSAQWTSRSIVAAIREAVRNRPRSAASSPSAEFAFEPINSALAAAPDRISVEVRGDDEVGKSPDVGSVGSLPSLARSFRDVSPKEILFNPKDDATILFPKPSLLRRLGFRSES